MDQPLHCLHLEDDPADAELIRLTLEAESGPVSVVHVSRRDDFVAAIQGACFDLVLSDYAVPGFNGPEALEIARSLAPDLPFIIVSGALDEETAVALVRGGATDYVLKSRLRRLGPAVHQALREASERRARREAERQLNLHVERLALLADAAQSFAEAGPDFRSVLNAVARRVADLLGDACTLRLLSDDAQWLAAAAVWHANPNTLAVLRGLAAQPLPAADGSIASQVVSSGHSRLIPVMPPGDLRQIVGEAWWPYWEQHGAHSLVAAPLWSRGRVIGVMVATRDVTPTAYDLDDQHLLRGLADRAALVIENARLYEAAQSAWGAAEVAADRAERLQNVTALLSAALTPDQVGRIIVNEGAAVLGATAATLQLLAPAGDQLHVVNVTREALPEQPRRVIPLTANTPSAEVMRTGQAVWLVSHAQAVECYPHLSQSRLVAGYEALAVLPITVESRLLGTLAINFPQTRVFSGEEQAFMLTLAGLCAQALERARLFAEVQVHNAALEARVRERTEQLHALTARLESLREDERTRIAREVHDELGGALTAIKMDITRLARHGLEPGAAHEAALASTLALIDETVQTVRRIATDLRPALLDDFGLAAAIEWQAQEFARRTGIECQLDLETVEVELERSKATALFRVFQETLTNVARHAHATRVTIRLAWQPGSVLMTLHDNGQGFRLDDLAGSPSLGLAGMRERILSIAGELDLQTQPGQGTTVIVTVPVP